MCESDGGHSDMRGVAEHNGVCAEREVMETCQHCPWKALHKVLRRNGHVWGLLEGLKAFGVNPQWSEDRHTENVGWQVVIWTIRSAKDMEELVDSVSDQESASKADDHIGGCNWPVSNRI